MTLINKCKTDTVITKLKSEIKILSTNTKGSVASVVKEV